MRNPVREGRVLAPRSVSALGAAGVPHAEACPLHTGSSPEAGIHLENTMKNTRQKAPPTMLN